MDIVHWNNQLVNNIKDKENEIIKIIYELNKLEESNSSKKNDLDSLEETMNITMSTVKKNILDYSKNISEKINKDDTFSLYKELYNDACLFFKKESLSVYDYFGNDWIEIPTSIYEIENQYKYMEQIYEVKKNIYDNCIKEYEDKKTIYRKKNEELHNMKKELEALQEFINKRNDIYK